MNTNPTTTTDDTTTLNIWGGGQEVEVTIHPDEEPHQIAADLARIPGIEGVCIEHTSKTTYFTPLDQA